MDIQPPHRVVHEEKYIHMSMLIQGPTQPGNDINLYLQLLKEELHTLWTELGVMTWEASTQEYFPMRAALITMVHNYLGYGYVMGQVCHSLFACVRCMDNTAHHQLKEPGSSKPVFMVHQSWLEMDDVWRRRGDLSDGTYEI